MRRSQVLLVLIAISFLSFSSVAAHSDSIPGDPVMQVDDPTCGGVEQPPCPIVGDNTPFTFMANAQGGGATSFEVDPTADTAGLFNLDIETLGTFATTSDVQCFSNVFECHVSFIGNNTVTDIFLSENGDAGKFGLAPGAIFTIDLGNLSTTNCDPNTTLCPTTTAGGWQANQLFTAQGDLPNGAPTTPLIPSPEPSSMFLLAAGTTVLWRRGKSSRR